MMAAINVMGIDPMSVSDAKKCEDWLECDLTIQCELAQHEQGRLSNHPRMPTLLAATLCSITNMTGLAMLQAGRQGSLHKGSHKNKV